MTPNIDNLLDRPIAFHRSFVAVGGSVNAALFLSQAVYWQRREKNADGRWWYKTAADWQEETGLTWREQSTARKALKAVGVLEERLSGAPAKLHYRVDTERLMELLGAREASIAQSAKLDSRIPRNKPSAKRETAIETETSPKTSTETSEKRPDADAPVPGPKANGKSDQKVRQDRFNALWSEAFQRANGTPYPFAGGRDGKASWELNGNGRTPEEVVALATWAWEHLDPVRDSYVWAQVQTIHGFLAQQSVLLALRAKAGEGPKRLTEAQKAENVAAGDEWKNNEW